MCAEGILSILKPSVEKSNTNFLLICYYGLTGKCKWNCMLQVKKCFCLLPRSLVLHSEIRLRDQRWHFRTKKHFQKVACDPKITIRKPPFEILADFYLHPVRD